MFCCLEELERYIFTNVIVIHKVISKSNTRSLGPNGYGLIIAFNKWFATS